MRAILQRVQSAQVAVDGEVVGSCGQGLCLLVGAHKGDTDENAKKLAQRVKNIRIFNDEEGKMNLSMDQLPEEANVSVLAVSNFTVYGDAAKSRRPSFVASAPYDEGERLFNAFVKALRELDVKVETGVFGAHMQVSMVNDGPVTLVIDC